MLRTNNSLINIDALQVVPPKRKRTNVTFDTAALEMAKKHEANPTRQNHGQYRKSILLGSASSWGQFNLDMFKARFNRDTYDALPDVVLNHVPKGDSDDSLQRNVISKGYLNVGIQRLRDAALTIPTADLLRMRSAEVRSKLENNPLYTSFNNLSQLLNQQSQEQKDRIAERNREARVAKIAACQFTAPEENKPAPNSPLPRKPSTIPTTPTQKRNVSDTSFGSRSTETTPTKLTKPEKHIQTLQDALVSDILKYIYFFQIPVPWVRNRVMTLEYEPQCKLSFRCRLPDNETKKYDFVTAIPDGAIVLNTDKRKDPNASTNWSRQPGCLLFEAKRLDVSREQLESMGETFIRNAEAQARAAQIYAEMLGLVCHREYFALGDQMAFVVQLKGFEVSFYWAEFKPEYLAAVQNGTLTDAPPVSLRHTKPLSLLDPQERDQFLEQFLAVVRCLAAGDGNVGFLRRDDNSAIHRQNENVVSSEDDGDMESSDESRQEEEDYIA